MALRVAFKNYTRSGIANFMNRIALFIKTQRNAANLTQEQFAEISRIGLHALRDLEQGKDNITLHKINQALAMFGTEAVPGQKWDD